MNTLFEQSFKVIRALSWNQPYASLMLHGKIETRSYHTNVRGKVLICAAQKAYPRSIVQEISGERQCARGGELLGIRGGESFQNRLLTEQAIAIGDLVECRIMLPEDADKCFVAYREPWEHISKKTGKKTIKRLWCWVFENVQEIEPFPYKGKQGWGILTPDIIEQIKIKKQ